MTGGLPFDLANLTGIVLIAIARHVGARRLVEVQGVHGPELRRLIDSGRVIALDLELGGKTPAAELEMVAAWLDELEALAEAESWGWAQVVERSAVELAMLLVREAVAEMRFEGVPISAGVSLRRGLEALARLDVRPDDRVFRDGREWGSADRLGARVVLEGALAREVGGG